MVDPIVVLPIYKLTPCIYFFAPPPRQFPPAADGATDKAAEAEGEAEEGAVPEVNSGVCIVEYDNYPAAQRAHRLGACMWVCWCGLVDRSVGCLID